MIDFDNVILNEVGDLIKSNIAKLNLTELEISAACDELNNQETKTNMEANLGLTQTIP